MKVIILSILFVSCGFFKGPKGNTGPQGIQGIPGPQGPSGEDGIGGVDGIRGPTGAPGVPGMNGQDGMNGEHGRDGADGMNGEHGRDGTDGRDGYDGEDAQVAYRWAVCETDWARECGYGRYVFKYRLTWYNDQTVTARLNVETRDDTDKVQNRSTNSMTWGEDDGELMSSGFVDTNDFMVWLADGHGVVMFRDKSWFKTFDCLPFEANTRTKPDEN